MLEHAHQNYDHSLISMEPFTNNNSSNAMDHHPLINIGSQVQSVQSSYLPSLHNNNAKEQVKILVEDRKSDTQDETNVNTQRAAVGDQTHSSEPIKNILAAKSISSSPRPTQLNDTTGGANAEIHNSNDSCIPSEQRKSKMLTMAEQERLRKLDTYQRHIFEFDRYAVSSQLKQMYDKNRWKPPGPKIKNFSRFLKLVDSKQRRHVPAIDMEDTWAYKTFKRINQSEQGKREDIINQYIEQMNAESFMNEQETLNKQERIRRRKENRESRNKEEMKGFVRQQFTFEKYRDLLDKV